MRRDGREAERAPDVRGAAPDDRQQEIRHEATHATAVSPRGVDRRRPHSGIGPIGRFSISTGSAIGSSRAGRPRPDRRSPAVSAPTTRSSSGTSDRGGNTKRRARAIGKHDRVALGAPRRSTSSAGDTAGVRRVPTGTSTSGARELEQRPERDPLEHVARAHQHAALERRDPVPRAAPTPAARSRAAAATAPGSTGSAPPPSAPPSGRRLDAQRQRQIGPRRAARRGAVRASGARTRTTSSIAASTGSGDTSVTPPGREQVQPIGREAAAAGSEVDRVAVAGGDRDVVGHGHEDVQRPASASAGRACARAAARRGTARTIRAAANALAVAASHSAAAARRPPPAPAPASARAVQVPGQQRPQPAARGHVQRSVRQQRPAVAPFGPDQGQAQQQLRQRQLALDAIRRPSARRRTGSGRPAASDSTATS